MTGRPGIQSSGESSALAAYGTNNKDSDNQLHKGRPWCDHCRRPGHIKEKCWKIHGKSADWKPRKPQSENHGHVDTIEVKTISEDVVFSKEQLELLQNMFNHAQINPPVIGKPRDKEVEHPILSEPNQDPNRSTVLAESGNDYEEMKRLKTILAKEFEIKYLEKLKYFFGMEVAHSNKGISISQRKYTLDLLKETGMLGCKPADQPVKTKHVEIDRHFIREKIEGGIIQMVYAASSHQTADILTKALPKVKFDNLNSKLGMINIYSQLEGSEAFQGEILNQAVFLRAENDVHFHKITPNAGKLKGWKKLVSPGLGGAVYAQPRLKQECENHDLSRA
ncbi:hypothetical protein RJ639_035619 [Escallonia herrerae]|uniref:Reverse transcriptase Ty1/copia-type domain-containing protein n=1 Tax=Escallonia herrerae TaxID=1293975 RepID=A0AA88WV46_9ASTE|nr:hypothetical protein RJ639_035619 [Escallonia herrerae]